MTVTAVVTRATDRPRSCVAGRVGLWARTGDDGRYGFVTQVW